MNNVIKLPQSEKSPRDLVIEACEDPRIRNILLAVARRMVPFDHEGLFQDTMEKILRFADRYDPTLSKDPLPWFKKIMFNVYRDKARSYKIKEESYKTYSQDPVHYLSQNVLDPYSSTPDKIASATRVDVLLEALSEFPPETVELLIAHHLEGIKCRELAKERGLKYSNIKVKIFRIRKKLQERLKKYAMEKYDIGRKDRNREAHAV